MAMQPMSDCPMGLKSDGTCPLCGDPSNCMGRGGTGAPDMMDQGGSMSPTGTNAPKPK